MVKISLPLKRQDIDDLVICYRLLSFRDATLFTSHGRLQNPAWAGTSCHRHTCNCWPFSSCVMKSDRRVSEGRVSITLASWGKNVRLMVSTICMLFFLVASSFLLVSCDSAVQGGKHSSAQSLMSCWGYPERSAWSSSRPPSCSKTLRILVRGAAEPSAHNWHVAYISPDEERQRPKGSTVSRRCMPDIACEKKK